MALATPWSGIPFPELPDTPNGPVAFFNQGSAVDKLVVPTFASAAARDAAATSATLEEGMKCWRSDTHRMESYDGTYWCEHIPRRIIPPGVGDVTCNSATVPVSVTGFAFTVKAGFLYNFVLHISYRRDDPAGCEILFSTPAGTTLSWRANALAGTVTDSVTGNIDGFDHGGSSCVLGGRDDNTLSQLAFPTGWAKVTTDGTIQLQVQQSVTTAGSTKAAVINLARSWGYVECMGPA